MSPPTADRVTAFTLVYECTAACLGELYRHRRRVFRPRQAVRLLLVAFCLTVLWTTVRDPGRSDNSPTPLPSLAAMPPPPPHDMDATALAVTVTHRVAVTVRSQHTGKYWQVAEVADGAVPRRRVSASASPQERGLERTVFVLEQEGDPESGGWVLLRWLKTRQLVEAVPPGVPGREDDAWSVQLSDASAVNELHKLVVEDNAAHTSSYVWSVALRGYLNHLETSGEVVGHADVLPPTIASEPPPRGAVVVERLQNGAGWLMEALEERDRQLDALQVS